MLTMPAISAHSSTSPPPSSPINFWRLYPTHSSCPNGWIKLVDDVAARLERAPAVGIKILAAVGKGVAEAHNGFAPAAVEADQPLALGLLEQPLQGRPLSARFVLVPEAQAQCELGGAVGMALGHLHNPRAVPRQDVEPAREVELVGDVVGNRFA